MASKTNLPALGRAPNFTGITAWFNTPGNQPLSLSDLKGKVVLVDFWTYSCINCQRALPHVEGWYNDYKNDGLVIVGVSSPEFAFEHVVSNVKSAATAPRHRLPRRRRRQSGHLGCVQQRVLAGRIPHRSHRHRTCLRLRRGRLQRHGEQHPDAPHRATASPTCHPARTSRTRPPTSEALTPESYLGYDRLDNEVGTSARTKTSRSRITRRRRSPRTAWPSAAPGRSTPRRPPWAPMPPSGSNSRPTTSISS